MSTPNFDPGITQRFSAPLTRIINKDGTFNVRRRGTHWRDIHPFLYLISMPWPQFLLAVFLGYLAAITAFALVYYALGPDALQGANAPTGSGRFLHAFFFSAQTLSTVGYGNISPKATAANFIAVFQAMVGVMGFAMATGLLFGRFSKPSARFGFSGGAIIAPYQNGSSLQFRVVNRRTNALMDIDARVLLMTVEGPPDDLRRRYDVLTLERPALLFLPLTWTIVHPIDPTSPLYGKTAADLKRLQAELLILVRAYDETFGQTVHARYSYRYDEILWDARFASAFEVDEAGELVLDVDRVGEYAMARVESS
jgi:inward rectifier potassium channel